MKLSSIVISGIILMGCISSCKQKPAVPRYDHVIVVMEENHSYDEVIGSGIAPYITQLAKEGALFTDAHGVVHPSQPNYLAIFSGGTQGVLADECLQDTLPYTTPNIAASVIRAGFTFKGFAETMPSVGFLGCDNQRSTLTGSKLYARKHAPWVNWQGTQANGIPAEVSRPMTDFPKDFNELPTVSFVIPDMDNDMHNIGTPGDTAAIQRGDTWLKNNLEAYVEWAKTHNSLLILTFDEDDFKEVNHIPTIFVGAGVKPGTYDEKINHYSVLHTIEAMYNLPVEDTNSQKAITSIWMN
ncbi:alkaline phosphatase family protein [Chitinophaga sp. MM2321]|uniref:alkaline phosphatase family protein n=1 Tax=Chitinophaga sp. MM2321 TaxID=3137178 RepID=UPI0032D588E4